MTNAARTRLPPRPARPAFGAMGVSFALALVAALVLMIPAASASSYRPGDPVSWSNGLVLCQFAPASPSVAVSHAGVSGTGVTVSLRSLGEFSPTGSTVATANLSGAVWTVANLSSYDAYYDLAYSSVAPIAGISGGSSPIGSVELEVQFVLPNAEGSEEPSNQVSVQISVANWTWQSVSDHLELAFGAAPSFPSAEHLSPTTEPGWLLTSTSNASGKVLEQMGANATAAVVPRSGPTTTVAANASLALSSPAQAVVTVDFGSSAGAYSSLSYEARVGVVIPAQIAGIPTVDLAAAAVAGAAVCMVVAAVTGRIRRRPSQLIYVTEEEEP